MLDVTSVPFTFTLLILYPASGVKIIVAEVPSFTVNGTVFPLTIVPLYDAEPLPVAVIVSVYVVIGIASNSTSMDVLLLILLIVYLLLDILAVTSVPFTFTLLILYPVSGLKVIVADVPSLTVKEIVFPLTVVPLYNAEPLSVDLIVSSIVVVSSTISLKFELQQYNS